MTYESDNYRWAARLPGWAREQYEERAAIMEFEGNLPRAEAEAKARVAVEERMLTMTKARKLSP